MSYWVHYKDRAPGCVLDDTNAPKFGTVLAIFDLPYPANPVLDNHPNACPAFCYTPEQCKGKSSCRKNWACSE